MKKFLKIVVLCGIIACFGIMPGKISEVNAAQNYVPAYYYANYKFIDDWNEIWNIFRNLTAKKDLELDIDPKVFSELYKHFVRSFPHLTPYYETVYEKCRLLADDLRNGYSYSSMEALMGNSCYRRLSQAASDIASTYTVKPVYSVNPNGGMAPLTVTFDARKSVDPSSETIPTKNFYRYYRDGSGVDRPMGEGNLINYTFEEAGRFIVHLVVRSSNVDAGILDGEQDIVIDVAPKAANIVVYANTRKMTRNSPIKIGTSEGEKGVIFDGSATMPIDGRRIMSHEWTITNPDGSVLYHEENKGAPRYLRPIFLNDNGEYGVTLTTYDNESNKVSETFRIYISDPVSVIRQTPDIGDTSTVMTFDGSASYSIKSKLSTYVWEIFNEEGDKIQMDQGKKISRIFMEPGNYLVRLIVTAANDSLQNEDIKEVFIDSTTPTPQFVVTPTSKRTYPSEFTLDASSSTDVDVLHGVDSLEYERSFSTDKYTIKTGEANNRRIVVQFDDVGWHTIELKVSDQYGKFAIISKTIEVKSTLRPEIEAIPGAITRGKTMYFKSTINKPQDSIFTYVWNYGDGEFTDSQSATNVTHVYGQRGVYPVTLTVYDRDGNENTVTERVFIGEVAYPIAAYRVTNDQGFYIQASDECKIEGTAVPQQAYPIDRYAGVTINPSISVNTQGNSNGLTYVFEPESMIGSDNTIVTPILNHRFNQVGCHYVDLTIQDSNIGRQDKTRIRFNVKNALPRIGNVTLSFPQYSESSSVPLGFATTNSTTNQTVFDCNSGSNNNVVVKVTAVDAVDSDGTVSRLRFYYYNIDDPDRILDSKETWVTNPYAYFTIPRVGGEYKFGVMVYDNDGGMIDSKEYLGSNPSIYFPPCNNDSDVPTVVLKLSSQNIEVGDTVTYSIVSRITSNNQDFDTDRTFYYDFTGDGTWDLVTKKDSATYTFLDSYENGIEPRAAVEYRGKLGIGNGAKVYVRNGIKPILLYNSIGNTVIFRDLSIGVFQQRQVCFDVDQCKLGNTNYQRTHIITKNLTGLTSGTPTVITENDSFLQKYPSYGPHEVSIYLKNKYGVEVRTGFTVKTSDNSGNGRIAPGINMITIPETTFNNSNPELFLSRAMNNTVLMYINNDTGDDCYVDMDIDNDSNGDGQKDNDIDILCNKMAKIVYQPNYQVIGRIYFKNNGQLTFKNFYVQFEGYVLELDDEKLAIYKDITTLINGIEDSSIENSNLKTSLNTLRNKLNDITVVTPTVIAINEQIAAGGIRLDQKQKDLLESVLDRLANADTVVSVGMSAYEVSKREILTMIGKNNKIKPSVEEGFSNFEDVSTPDERAETLSNLFDNIMKNGGLDKDDKKAMQGYFCSIVEYYNLTSSTDICMTQGNDIEDNYKKARDGDTSGVGKWPSWLKIVLFILVGGLLAMGGIILFFSIKAKLSSNNDEDEG